MISSKFSISQIVVDVETAFERNFNEERVDALTKIFNDFGTIARVSERVRQQIEAGEGVRGLSVDVISSLVKDPWLFAGELITWAGSKGVTLQQAAVGSILNAEFRPENVSPEEWLDMIADPRMALCDPSTVSRLFESKNMTSAEIQVSVNHHRTCWQQTADESIVRCFDRRLR